MGHKPKPDDEKTGEKQSEVNAEVGLGCPSVNLVWKKHPKHSLNGNCN